jgi:hypothetical protein
MSLFTNLLQKSIREFLRKRRKWLIRLTIAFGVLIGINFLINNYVDKVVGDLIREFVDEKSDGFYQVEFSELAYILNDGRFLITDFRFDIHPDRRDTISFENLDQSYLYTAGIPRLHIDIVDFWSIFVQRKLRVIGIEVNTPTVKIVNLNKSKSPKKISFEAGNLYKALSGHLEELKINDFEINNGTVDFETYNAPDYDNFYVQGLTFRVKNFQVNEESSERSDKIFYTDDIYLEVNDQELLLKDSIHKASFGKFYLSTTKNEIGFEKLKLTRRENPLADQHDRDHYEVSLPQLRFAGVDFLSAYNDNFLLIDSIDIISPSVRLIKRTIQKTKKSQRHNFLDIAMMYHDYLEIGQFNLADAQLTYTDETGEISTTYSFDQISTKITQVKIDTGRHSIRNYGIDFDRIDLAIRDHEVTLPDSANTLSFDELTISSDPRTISLKELEYQPTPNQMNDPSKTKFFAKVPYLVVTGFDLSKAINHDTLAIDEIYLEHPEFRIIQGNAHRTSVKKFDPSELFGSLQKINAIASLLALDKFSLTQGRLLLEASGDQPLQSMALEQINVDLLNIKVDRAADFQNHLLGRAELALSLATSKLSTKDADIQLRAIDFSTTSGRMKLDSISFVNNARPASQHLKVLIPEITLTGIDIDEILFSSNINFDTLKIDHADLALQSHTGQAHQSGSKPSSTSNLPAITIGHLIGNNHNIEYKNDQIPLFKVNDIDFNIAGLTLDQSLSDNVRNQFDYEQLHNLSVNNYQLVLKNQAHFFNAGEIRLSDNTTFSMQDIRLVPYGKPNNEYRIHVPSVRMTGIDLKKILKESYYIGNEIVIDRPEIDLKLTAGRQEKLTSLDLGFIPILMRNRFLGAKSDLFQINHGAITVHQKSDGDSLLFECDDMNLDVLQFQVDSTTEMLPERFLFANDIRLEGDYISAYQPSRGAFFSINHYYVSTKEQDLKFEGIYYTSNARDLADQPKTKLTVAYLNLLDLDFYSLTQNQTLRLAEIDIANADLTMTPLPKKNEKPVLRINSPDMPSDTILLQNIRDNISYGALFSQKAADSVQIGQRQKQKSAGLNIHKKEFLFDTLILKQIEIDKIFLTDTKIDIENPVEQKSDLIIPDVWLLAEGIKYNPVLAKDSGRIFYSDKICTKISNLNYILPDNLSAVKFSELQLNSADSTIKIKNFALEPRISKFDFGAAKGYQATWLRIENDSISIQDVDFQSIINDRRFAAEKLNINTMNFEIYRDKRIPFPEWQRRPLPQVELHKIDFTIALDTIKLMNGYIGYQEHAEKSNTPGEIYFTDLNAKVANLSNDSARLIQMPKTSISATTKVFGKGRIVGEFQFDMLHPDNIHIYGIEVDSFDLTEFNRILIPNASAQIKSGKNKKIVMTARANEDYSYGEMRFYYNDLKVQLLSKETETPKGLGNMLGSFFANTFIIKTNNPRNFVVKKGDIFFERDKKRAIFNYWTKTFLSGVISSIGAANNKKKIKQMQEENLKKIEENKSENLNKDNYRNERQD